MKSAEPSSSPAPRRRYDASRRQADAQERQRRVAEVAGALFLAQGYGATSIDQVAKAAGVSAPSIYATFESKAGLLLRAMHQARTGDVDGSLRESEDARAIAEATDLRTRCAATAALLRAAYERSAGLIAIVERASAIDPALRDLHEELRATRWSSVDALSVAVPDGAFRGGLTRKEAIDVMAFLGAAHTYTELVDGFGWTPERYETWLADALYQALFAPD